MKKCLHTWTKQGPGGGTAVHRPRGAERCRRERQGSGVAPGLPILSIKGSLKSRGVRAFYRRGCQDLSIEGNQHKEVLSVFFSSCTVIQFAPQGEEPVPQAARFLKSPLLSCCVLLNFMEAKEGEITLGASVGSAASFKLLSHSLEKPWLWQKSANRLQPS